MGWRSPANSDGGPRAGVAGQAGQRSVAHSGAGRGADVAELGVVGQAGQQGSSQGRQPGWTATCGMGKCSSWGRRPCCALGVEPGSPLWLDKLPAWTPELEQGPSVGLGSSVRAGSVGQAGQSARPASGVGAEVPGRAAQRSSSGIVDQAGRRSAAWVGACGRGERRRSGIVGLIGQWDSA